MGLRTLLFFLCALLAVFSKEGASSREVVDRPVPALTSRTARLPALFEANVGQWDAAVSFAARRRNAILFLTAEGATLAPRSEGTSAVTIAIAGASRVAPRGEDRVGTTTNYFVGNDPSRWRASVSTFAKARSTNVVSGVDVVWRGADSGFEFDLVVASGTDASKIVLEIEGAAELRLRDDGALRIAIGAGEIVQHPPRVLQNGVELPSSYRLVDRSHVAFVIEGYDARTALLIDPVLSYSTYLGAGDDELGFGTALDAAGNVYVAGYTYSTNFPTQGAEQGSNAGSSDVFVGKLNAAGDALAYATYLGGSSDDVAMGIAVDASGNAYVVGQTYSGNFPMQSAIDNSYGGRGDAFVSKINASGNALVYSTYLGGSNDETASAVAVDSAGAAYVAGSTSSTNFPTHTPFQGSNAGTFDAFVSKINAAGNALSYSTYLGGSDYDYAFGITVDASSAAYVTGQTFSTGFPTASAYQGSNAGTGDAFVTKLSAAGTSLAYSTYLGGSAHDIATGIGLDNNGRAYVVGHTTSTNFPTSGAYQGANAGGFDAFVTELGAAGSSLVYSTYLGGSGDDHGQGIVVDGAGNATLVGTTFSTNFPTQNATQGASAGNADVFLTKIAAGGGSLFRSTYVGGASADYGFRIGANATGEFALTGHTQSSAFPMKNALIGANAATDAFVVRYSPVSLTVTPATATVAPRGTKSFSASAGAGGYVYGFQSTGSGASIDGATGAYTAGTTGSTTDVVLVTDSSGDIGLATVTVGPGVGISPSSPTTPPRGTITFSASDGSGTGYTWAVTPNNSGATISGAGVYKAGSTPNVTDTVKATDSLGNIATVSVSVGPGVSITPSGSTVAPLGTVSFSASDGSGTGYTWAISPNNSGGTISGAGGYKAGATGSVADTVKATDSLGNVATVSVAVTAAVAISPSTPSVAPKGALSFTASGGAGPYTFDVPTHPSGATIDGAGAYTAGSVGSVSDIVRVTDSLGATSTTTVSVGPGITILPANPSAPLSGTIAFSATGGSGTGYTWTLSASPSGGNIVGPTGAYAAGGVGKVIDVVVVTDSLGNTKSANVPVGEPVTITPAGASAAPKGNVQFAVIGGSGVGFVWSLATNASGGAIDATTGAYVAGKTGEVTDVVKATDSLGNADTVEVKVTASLAIAPKTADVLSGGAATFTATGGSGRGYVFSITPAGTGGGAIDPASGAYTAGANARGVDTVKVEDSLGNVDTATVTVGSVDAGVGAATDGGGETASTESAACGCRTVGARGTGSFGWSGVGFVILLGVGFGRGRGRHRLTAHRLTAMAAVVVLAACMNGEAETSREAPVQHVEERIIGTQRSAASYPEAVQVSVNNAFSDFCSGVILAPRVVLTAAHCVAFNPGGTWTVTAPFASGGAQTRSANLAEPMDSAFYALTRSNYDSHLEVHDVALIYVTSPFVGIPIPTLSPAQYPQWTVPNPVMVSAVGRQSVSSAAGLVLSASVQLAYPSAGDGYTKEYKTIRITDGGDSGGPLFIEGTHKLVGSERAFSAGGNDFWARHDGAVYTWITMKVNAHGGFGSLRAP